MSAHLYQSIRRAYATIGDATPVNADCGKLCNAACCQGDDEMGMLLFPGEAPRLSRIPGFRVSRIDYMDSKAWLLTCDGVCNRSTRPLSCRIFPLAPHVDPHGVVTALPDPRARSMCPLADCKYVSKRFSRRVELALTQLSQDPKMLGFMKTLSLELEELRRLIP